MFYVQDCFQNKKGVRETKRLKGEKIPGEKSTCEEDKEHNNYCTNNGGKILKYGKA